jgi:hypothetical protein
LSRSSLGSSPVKNTYPIWSPLRFLLFKAFRVFRGPPSALFPPSDPSPVCPPSSVLRPLSSVLRPLSSVLRPLSSVLRPPSSVLRPPPASSVSALRDLCDKTPSSDFCAFCASLRPTLPICRLPSVARFRLSAFQLSVFCSPPSFRPLCPRSVASVTKLRPPIFAPFAPLGGQPSAARPPPPAERPAHPSPLGPARLPSPSPRAHGVRATHPQYAVFGGLHTCQTVLIVICRSNQIDQLAI